MKPILLLFALCISAAAQITVTPNGSVNLAAPGAIGGTTPSTGSFTTLTASTVINTTGNAPLVLNGQVGLYGSTGNTLSIRSGASDQTFNLYGLDTDASNYHYGSLAMSDTAFTISTATLGGGVDNLSISFTPSGTGTINVGSNGLYNSDGTKRLNQGLSVYAAGTAYAMTNSAAALDFGTTDPTVVLDSPGTYLIFGRGLLKYNGATYAGTQTATIKLRRTNNTAADLTNATTTATLRIITTVTDTVGVMPLPPVIYTTANSDDSISVFGVLSAAPSVGTVEATEASIVAVRLYQ